MNRPGDHVSLNDLIHGVAYSPAPGSIGAILKVIPKNLPADFAIGAANRIVTRKPVIYPKLSLMEHADGEPVERHMDGQPRTESRRAWALAGELDGM